MSVSNEYRPQSYMLSTQPYYEHGRRLHYLRIALGYATDFAFARALGWQHSAMSMFLTGKRRVPTDKAMQLRARIPGFDPIWLWEGDPRGLGLELRTRIDAALSADVNPVRYPSSMAKW